MRLVWGLAVEQTKRAFLLTNVKRHTKKIYLLFVMPLLNAPVCVFVSPFQNNVGVSASPPPKKKKIDL